MLPTSPRLALNNYRAILFLLMHCPHCARVSSFRFFHQHYVTAVRPFSFEATDPECDSTRFGPVQSACPCCKNRGCIVRRALLLHVLRAKPGEHSFAEEAKVANYRVASREGGLMRSPMTGHIQSSFCSYLWTMPGDDSTLASKSTDRCVNPTTDAFVFVSHLLISTRFSVLKLSLFFLLSPSTGSSSALFFFSSGHHRSSLTIRTVPNLVRSEERSDPGDRRVRNSSKRFPMLVFFPQRGYPPVSSFFLPSLSFFFLIALIRTVSLRPRV